MTNAIHRTPCLETAEIRMLLNGPESFTLDGNFILGEAPELRRYFVCAGFNSAGIANAGGAGRLIAEWIIGGEAPIDLWDVDIRRFAPFHTNRRHLADRTAETLGLHYAMRWPREELATVRPLRRSPLYDRLTRQGRGVRQQAQLGARQLFPARGRAAAAADARHARLAAAMFSTSSAPRARTSSCSTRPRSPSSCSRAAMRLQLLQRLCANDIDVPLDRMVYTAMLNERGGFESDLTITRLAPDRFFILTGSAQATRDADWINRHIAATTSSRRWSTSPARTRCCR